MYETRDTGGHRSLSIARISSIGFTVFALVVLLIFGGKVFENVDASEIVLIQSIGGTMTWHTTPGWVWQGGGKVTRYQKRGIIRFQPAPDKDSADGRLPIVFNDGGKGIVKGSMNYELPMNAKQLTEMHSFYPDQDSLESGLVKPALNKAIYLTGPMMTSYESYKEKRSSLIQYVEDQAQNGVYRTRTVDREVDEEAIGSDGLPRTVKKKITVVEVQTDPAGLPMRNETGQLTRFGVKAFNFAIEDLSYDPTVTEQVKQQQQIAMAVQTSIGKAKQSLQDAVTAEATGRANIAQARAQQEISKTEAVVQGEKARDVAKLKSEEAGFYKTDLLLRADADSEYRRRIMSADNALAQRIDAYKYGVDKISSAIAQHQGSWVPSVVIGQQGGANGGQFNAVQSLIDIALVNQAKALGLDLGLTRTGPSVNQTSSRGAGPGPQPASSAVAQAAQKLAALARQ